MCISDSDLSTKRDQGSLKKKKEVTDYMFGRKKNLEVSLKIIVVTEK